MTRINSVTMQNTPKVQNINKSNKKITKNIFKEKLEHIKTEKVKEELKTLYGKIEEKTVKLQNRLFLDDLIEYKQLVKNFLNISVNNSHVFYKENSLDRRGRHRVYSIVKQVDSELDELTKDFLQVEDNRLSIFKRLDSIKGLLLDIIT